MFCIKCGAEVKEGENFCTKCGYPIKKKEAALQQEQEDVSESVENQSNEAQDQKEQNRPEKEQENSDNSMYVPEAHDIPGKVQEQDEQREENAPLSVYVPETQDIRQEHTDTQPEKSENTRKKEERENRKKERKQKRKERKQKREEKRQERIKKEQERLDKKQKKIKKQQEKIEKKQERIRGKQEKGKKKSPFFIILLLVAAVLTGCIYAWYTRQKDNDTKRPTEKVEKPMESADPAPTKEPVATPEMTAVPTTEPAKLLSELLAEDESLQQAKRLAKYQDILGNIRYANRMPDGTSVWEDKKWKRGINATDWYSIYDVDKDGAEELVLSISEDVSAIGLQGVVYGYNPVTDVLTQKLTASPWSEYYENKTVRDYRYEYPPKSDFRSYRLWRYNAEKNVYEPAYWVSAWDKNYTKKSERIKSKKKFPAEYDKDGDGIVYYVTQEEPDGTEGQTNIMDQAEFDAWEAEQTGGADAAPLQQTTFKDMEVSWSREYIKKVVEIADSYKQDPDYDMGVFYMEREASLDTVKYALEQNLGMTWEQEEDTQAFLGVYQGEKVCRLFYEDDGSMQYIKAAEGLYLCGIQVGMTVTDAEAVLREYGFKLQNVEDDHRTFITGEALGNYCIYIEVEGDIIKEISIHGYCSYAG